MVFCTIIQHSYLQALKFVHVSYVYYGALIEHRNFPVKVYLALLYINIDWVYFAIIIIISQQRQYSTTSTSHNTRRICITVIVAAFWNRYFRTCTYMNFLTYIYSELYSNSYFNCVIVTKIWWFHYVEASDSEVML